MNQDWHKQALALLQTGTMSKRGVARTLNVKRSTCLDFFKRYEDFKKPVEVDGVTHLVIPDSQVRPGISVEYLRHIGEYIVRKRPDVIVHLGDFCDFESLGQYDKGKRSAEGKRVQADIAASIFGMATLLGPLKKLQEQQKAEGVGVYEPRLVLTLGNHEDRLTRHVNSNPELHGFLDMSILEYEKFGWEVIPYLTPIKINGVNYCHFYPNVMTGKALTGTAQNMLKTIGESYTMGHRQTLDVATRFLPSSGVQQWGLIAGAGYPHQETYKGSQGNHHWRGIIVKHRVSNGSYDPLFISLDWLKSEYS